MTRPPCDAAVEVLLGGHFADEGALITCDLDDGHDDPHRAEWDEGTFAGIQAPDSGVTTVHIVITWITP